MTDSPQTDHSPSSAPTTERRRNFLVELAALLIGAVVTLVPTVAGAVFVLHPLLRKKSPAGGEASSGSFRRIGSASGLVRGGPPVLFQVIGSRKDAWTTYPEMSLGAVYVRMLEDGALEAFNASCPHLGCAVRYRPGAKDYLCPCHSSSFSLDGVKRNEIPPRNMDRLQAELREGEIWVEYQDFKTGLEEQVPV